MDTNITGLVKSGLDKNQEIIFFLILLSVSGVMPK
jgi:hypothetical protein